MTDLETAWFAGLMEGEGSFLFASPGRYKSTVEIAIEMCDEDVIARVAALFGLSYHRCVRTNKPHYKPTYKFIVRGRRAEDAMRLVLPFMGQRRSERIRQVLLSVEHLPRYKPDNVLTKEMQNIVLQETVRGKSGREIGRMLGKHHSLVCRFLQIQRGEVINHHSPQFGLADDRHLVS